MFACLLIAMLGGCGTDTTSWQSAEDCKALDPGPNADGCWTQFAPDMFRENAQAAQKQIELHVTDPRIKDFIWLTVTREVDPSSYRYCTLIQEKALAERCRVLVSRPHLHRELLTGQVDQSTRQGFDAQQGPAHPIDPGIPAGGIQVDTPQDPAQGTPPQK